MADNSPKKNTDDKNVSKGDSENEMSGDDKSSSSVEGQKSTKGHGETGTGTKQLRKGPDIAAGKGKKHKSGEGQGLDDTRAAEEAGTGGSGVVTIEMWQTNMTTVDEVYYRLQSYGARVVSLEKEMKAMIKTTEDLKKTITVLQAQKIRRELEDTTFYNKVLLNSIKKEKSKKRSKSKKSKKSRKGKEKMSSSDDSGSSDSSDSGSSGEDSDDSSDEGDDLEEKALTAAKKSPGASVVGEYLVKYLKHPVPEDKMRTVKNLLAGYLKANDKVAAVKDLHTSMLKDRGFVIRMCHKVHLAKMIGEK